jgi:hypothetical protein
MGQSRRRYSREFKLEAVRQLQAIEQSSGAVLVAEGDARPRRAPEERCRCFYPARDGQDQDRPRGARALGMVGVRRGHPPGVLKHLRALFSGETNGA